MIELFSSFKKDYEQMAPFSQQIADAVIEANYYLPLIQLRHMRKIFESGIVENTSYLVDIPIQNKYLPQSVREGFMSAFLMTNPDGNVPGRQKIMEEVETSLRKSIQNGQPYEICFFAAPNLLAKVSSLDSSFGEIRLYPKQDLDRKEVKKRARETIKKAVSNMTDPKNVEYLIRKNFPPGNIQIEVLVGKIPIIPGLVTKPGIRNSVLGKEKRYSSFENTDQGLRFIFSDRYDLILRDPDKSGFIEVLLQDRVNLERVQREIHENRQKAGIEIPELVSV